jgi:hypothetical protein
MAPGVFTINNSTGSQKKEEGSNTSILNPIKLNFVLKTTELETLLTGE